MNMNRLFIGLLTAIIVLLPCREISAKQKKEVKEVPDREVWCDVMYRMAAPVLSNMSRGELQKKMQEELDYRRITLRPQLLEEVKVARSFGDLSENFEYKAAKRDKNKNESRIRFLENMIKTAVVIEDHSASDTVGLYDKVTVYLEEDGEEETWQVVTTVRQDVLHGLISKESPMGAALMGKRAGDRFWVQVNKDYGYYAVVRTIEKGQDDGSAQLNRY